MVLAQYFTKLNSEKHCSSLGYIFYFYFGSREFSRLKKFHQKSLKKFFDTFQLVVQEVDILPNLVNFVQYPSPLHPLINTSHTHMVAPLGQKKSIKRSPT